MIMNIDNDIAGPRFDLFAPGMTDEEILVEYRQTGNQDLFSELVHRYERELCAYLRRRFQDETLVEDALQMTFLRVHMNCEQFDKGRRLRPWLYAIASNTAIDFLRRKRRSPAASLQAPLRESGNDATPLIETLMNGEPMPVEHLDRREREEACRAAVMQLPERLRAVIDLFYFRNLKYREAAEVLSIPIGTVKSRIHEAVSRLRAIWNEGRVGSGEALSLV